MAEEEEGEGGKLPCVDHGPLNEGAVGKMPSGRGEKLEKSLHAVPRLLLDISCLLDNKDLVEICKTPVRQLLNTCRRLY